MHLQKLRLQNFRLFEDSTFVFNEGFNIIIGNNMTGKTSILEGIMMGCMHYLSKMGINRSFSIQNKDIRLQNFGRNIEPQFAVSLEHDYQLLDTPLSWKAIRKNRKSFTKKEDEELKNICSEITKKVQKNEPIILPLIACYPVERPTKEENYSIVPLGSRLEGYKEAFAATKNYQEVQSWLITKQDKVNRQINDFQKAELEFQLVKTALIHTLGLKDLFFDPELQTSKNYILHFELPDGRVLPVSALSSGYKIIFAIVGDLAMRCVRLNPHLGEKAIAETNGMVLIDELDQHLHPILQQKIINILRTTFPKLQFIVTTHSPHIIASAQAGEVIHLPDIEDFTELNGLTIQADQRSYQGWQVAYILRDLMLEKENGLLYEEMINPILDEINAAFEQKNLLLFQEGMEKLKKLVNPSDPILASLEIQKIRVKLQ